MESNSEDSIKQAANPSGASSLTTETWKISDDLTYQRNQIQLHFTKHLAV